jgi:hypothetical protein
MDVNGNVEISKRRYEPKHLAFAKRGKTEWKTRKEE